MLVKVVLFRVPTGFVSSGLIWGGGRTYRWRAGLSLGWQDPFVIDTAGPDLAPILPLLVSYFCCVADVIQFVG